MAATSDGTARVWDLDGHEQYSTNLLLDGGRGFALVDDRLLGGRRSFLTFDLSLRTAHLRDLRSGERRKSWSVPEGPGTITVAETPLGSALLVQANGALDTGAVYVWYLDDGPPEDASLLFPEPVTAVASDADGLVVAFAADFAVFDWPGL
jgi:hypothetical protein